jgi:hypothetical protein
VVAVLVAAIVALPASADETWCSTEPTFNITPNYYDGYMNFTVHYNFPNTTNPDGSSTGRGWELTVCGRDAACSDIGWYGGNEFHNVPTALQRRYTERTSLPCRRSPWSCWVAYLT